MVLVYVQSRLDFSSGCTCWFMTASSIAEQRVVVGSFKVYTRGKLLLFEVLTWNLLAQEALVKGSA
jgi:hypothetical protein